MYRKTGHYHGKQILGNRGTGQGRKYVPISAEERAFILDKGLNEGWNGSELSRGCFRQFGTDRSPGTCRRILADHRKSL